MSNNKSQISPIPPEGYGDRFVKFISGITMTKEEQERQAETGEQLDGSIDTTRQPSVPLSRNSNENKVVEKAEKHAAKTEREGATEEPQRDRTLSAVRSPSADRSSGIAGATLPVVEEDSSREHSVNDEKPKNAHPYGGPLPPERLPPTPPDDRLPNDKQLPSLPSFNRLSMGIGSGSGAAH